MKAKNENEIANTANNKNRAFFASSKHIKAFKDIEASIKDTDLNLNLYDVGVIIKHIQNYNIFKPAKNEQKAVRDEIIKCIQDFNLKYNHRLEEKTNSTYYAFCQVGLFIGILSLTGSLTGINSELIHSNNKLKKINYGILNTDMGISCQNTYNSNCDVCSICYSQKFERMYYDTVIHHLKQVVYFYTTSTERIAQDLIDKLAVFEGIRINENGDLNNKWQLEKLNNIFNIVFDHVEKPVYIYSKCDGLLTQLHRGIIKTYSKPATATPNINKFYVTAWDKEELKEYNEAGYKICKVNCAKCGTCQDAKPSRIVCMKH